MVGKLNIQFMNSGGITLNMKQSPNSVSSAERRTNFMGCLGFPDMEDSLF
ncbi:WSSV602 [White spot syndrome virus]|uniref:WSSV602 n=1 Tax=White spot syndrome virus TaxID=342409 RepID=A0A2I6SCM4_9VIRU|nr:WSSV602 [White spot syndrome virus]